MSETEKNKNYGRICVFLSRSCGTLTAIKIAGSIARCLPTGLLIIISSVVMFFLEAAVLGYCFERMAFLVNVSKYANNWVRFVLYLIFAIIPILIWCISASTLVCLGLFFMVSALNFILAIGIKGDHTGVYEKVSLTDLKKLEAGEETEDSESTSLPTLKDSATL